jgi:hypothetical protein
VSRETRSTVRLAYLELMAPTLDEAIDALAAQGATAIRVVPVFLAADARPAASRARRAAAAPVAQPRDRSADRRAARGARRDRRGDQLASSARSLK